VRRLPYAVVHGLIHIDPQKFDKSLDRKDTRAHPAGMELKSLDLFVAVARRLSFAAVAKDRGVDPSSVSRAVGELEAELGLRLFQRTTRTMTLTEAGEVYLARIEPLVEEATGARDLAAQVVGKPRGTLRMSASVTFGQKGTVRDFVAWGQRFDIQAAARVNRSAKRMAN
jgi:DNA-binding transcriptional LysR family regulator